MKQFSAIYDGNRCIQNSTIKCKHLVCSSQSNVILHVSQIARKKNPYLSR